MDVFDASVATLESVPPPEGVFVLQEGTVDTQAVRTASSNLMQQQQTLQQLPQQQQIHRAESPIPTPEEIAQKHQQALAWVRRYEPDVLPPDPLSAQPIW